VKERRLAGGLGSISDMRGEDRKESKGGGGGWIRRGGKGQGKGGRVRGEGGKWGEEGDGEVGEGERQGGVVSVKEGGGCEGRGCREDGGKR